MHVRPRPIVLMTPFVDSVEKRPKVSLTCWRVVLRLRRISTLRVIMRPSKVLFWEILGELQLSDTMPPWYSPAVPKPIYESPKAQAYWDIPVFAVSEQVKQNRVDARFIDHEKKKVLAVEMSCPWTQNREKKQEEKIIKYGPLPWELKQQFPGYDIRQYNIIIDVLGG